MKRFLVIVLGVLGVAAAAQLAYLLVPVPAETQAERAVVKLHTVVTERFRADVEGEDVSLAEDDLRRLYARTSAENRLLIKHLIGRAEFTSHTQNMATRSNKDAATLKYWMTLQSSLLSK